MHSCHRRHGDEPMEAYFWMGRRGGGRGHGPGGGRGFRAFAGSFMGGGFDGEGLRAGRKLAAGDLQLLLLQLLAEKPSHGYELIKSLEERSNGFYVPSPGMIYPALTYLEEVGYASVEAAGAKKLYRLTEEGEKHLAQNREAADAILLQLERIGQRMARLREAMAESEGPEDEAAGDGDHGGRELWLARRELKQALREHRRGSPAEVRRLAEILRRAAAEIRGKHG